jgi:mitogen-activated protein kinase kinase
MLLQHAWIADLTKPDTISEESEELEAAAESGADFEVPKSTPTTGDEEVREWVLAAMERRREYIEQGIKGPSKPALHAAPLDAHPAPISSTVTPEATVEGVARALESLRA